MAERESPFRQQLAQMIEKLKKPSLVNGHVFARSFEELYDSEEFAAVILSDITDEEYATSTSAVAWRFIIFTEGEFSSPIISLAPLKKARRTLSLFENTTRNLPKLEGDSGDFVESTMPMALHATSGLGLQTLAVMQISEHTQHHNTIVEIAYPHIYRELHQLDVLAQMQGLPYGPDFKADFGATVAARFLRGFPVGSEIVQV